MSIRELLKTGESTTNLKTTVTKTNLWDNPDHLDLKSKKSYWFFLRAWEICQVILNLLRHWDQCMKQPTVSVPGTVLGNSITGDLALSTDAGESPGLGDGRQTSESWLRRLPALWPWTSHFPWREIAPVITKVLAIPTTFLRLPWRIHVKEKIKAQLIFNVKVW